jgi:hypothetical protein
MVRKRPTAIYSESYLTKHAGCSQLGRLLQMCKTAKGKKKVGGKSGASKIGRALEECKR